jgi:hypothetical protein
LANRATNQKHRFFMLDTLLKWEGELSNGRVRGLLDIQKVQVSRLLSEYRDAYPNRVIWDPAKKRYLAQASRERFGGTADDYLYILAEKGDESVWIERLETNISSVRPEVLIALRRATEKGAAVRIDYTSMAQPEGQERDIFPHHIVQAGRRWHVRAWCCTRLEYRDFVLGRIRKITPADIEEKPSAKDVSWEARVDVRLVPHNNLSASQARVIRDELFEGSVARRIRTRGCLVPYVVQEVRASTSPDQIPPDYQIEVANLDEIRKYLFT